MKKKFWLLSLFVLLISVFTAACDTTTTPKIVLSAATPTVRAGETVQLTSDTAGVSYSLVEGGDFAEVNTNGLISVDADAPDGETIKAVATLGNIVSNVVQVAVLGAIVETPTISLTTQKLVAAPGETVQLESDTDGVTFALVESDSYATIDPATGVITIKTTATAGSIIKAMASKDGINSDIVQIVVVVTTEEKILLSSISPSVLPGGSVELSTDVTGVSYILLESGSEIASIDPATGILSVDAEAEPGTIIKIMAQKGVVSSNILQILVLAPPQVETLFLTAPTPLVKPGESIQLVCNVDDVTFELVDSSALATIDATTGEVAAKEDATVGETIKAIAKKGELTSNTVNILIIGQDEEPIELSASAYTIQPGGNVTLSATPSDVTYSLVGDMIDAEINQETGVLTALTTAAVGTKIVVVATKGNSASNTITIDVVHIPVTSLVASATETMLEKGESTTLNCIVTPTNTTYEVVWLILNGDDKATIEGNVLTINSDATSGIVQVFASAGNKYSNTIEISIYVPLESINVTSNLTLDPISQAYEVSPGGTVQFSAELLPANTTQTDIVWDITSIGSNASISSSGLLTVDAVATRNEIITIVAKRNGIVSNVFTVKVYIPTFSISTDNDSITIANTDTTATKTIEYDVTNDKGAIVHGMEIEYSVLEEFKDIIRIDVYGNFCVVRQEGHGTAYVNVKLVGYDSVTDVVNITSIKTPDAIFLPEFLQASISISSPVPMETYSIGKDQPIRYDADIRGVRVATDVTYKFENLDNVTEGIPESGDDVGIVNVDGSITFKKEGNIRLTVTTDSGNTPDKEKSVSYEFEINDFVNIDNWEDFKYYLQYNVNPITNENDDSRMRAVNFVVTSRPSEGYGFSIVPFSTFADMTKELVNSTNLETLKGIYGPGGRFIPRFNVAASDAAYYLEHFQIVTRGKDVIIRGNNHPVDFSKIPLIYHYERSEMLVIEGSAADSADYVSTENEGQKQLRYLSTSLVGAATGNPPVTSLYRVEANNLKLFGNSDVNGKNITSGDRIGGGTRLEGTNFCAISIGYYLSRANFEVKMDNVEIVNFAKAMKIHRAVTNQDAGLKSILSNVSTDFIYGTAFDFAMSQIELNNMKFGFTGAGPLEALTQFSGLSGLSENERQTITFTGYFDPGTPNNGNTQYYKDYSIMGAGFTTIMSTVLSRMALNQINHVREGFGTHAFVAFSFNDPALVFEVLEAATGSYLANLLAPHAATLLQIPEFSGDINKIVGYLVSQVLPGVELERIVIAFAQLGSDPSNKQIAEAIDFSKTITNVSLIEFAENIGTTEKLNNIATHGKDEPITENMINKTDKFIVIEPVVPTKELLVLDDWGELLMGQIIVVNAHYAPPQA